jgi:hypothetical protein
VAQLRQHWVSRSSFRRWLRIISSTRTVANAKPLPVRKLWSTKLRLPFPSTPTRQVAFHPLPNSREAANPGGTEAILRPGACRGDAGTRVPSVEKPGHTPGNVKLLLPPRQSRGNSHSISRLSASWKRHIFPAVDVFLGDWPCSTQRSLEPQQAPRQLSSLQLNYGDLDSTSGHRPVARPSWRFASRRR